MYYMAITRVKTGADPQGVGEGIGSHLRWVGEQIAAGKVVQAGKWGETAGVVIFRAGSDAEARSFCNEDPLQVSGLFDLEVDPFHPDVESPRFD